MYIELIANRMRAARSVDTVARYNRDIRELWQIVTSFAEHHGCSGQERVLVAVQMAALVPFPPHRSGGPMNDVYGLDFSIPGMVYRLWDFEAQDDMPL